MPSSDTLRFQYSCGHLISDSWPIRISRSVTGAMRHAIGRVDASGGRLVAWHNPAARASYCVNATRLAPLSTSILTGTPLTTALRTTWARSYAA